MTLEEVKRFREEMHEQSMSIIEKKGHDYNHKQQHQGDTLFNLRVAAILGIIDTPSQGVLVRLCDKMMRLASLMTPGVEAEIKDESIQDTIADVHNYIDYAYLLFMEEQEKRRLPVSYSEGRPLCEVLFPQDSEE